MRGEELSAILSRFTPPPVDRGGWPSSGAFGSAQVLVLMFIHRL